MPKYRDKVTGQVKQFDHEPTQQELWQAFGNTPSAPQSVSGEPSSFTEDAITKVGLPALGAILGGKTPLGPVGSGIGAAAGKGIGDVYRMLAGHQLPPTMGEEAAHLGEVGLGVAAGETLLPPALRAVGAVKTALPQGSGLVGGGGLGWLLGHTKAGLAAGAAVEGAPKLANGIEWFGRPAGATAIHSAEDAGRLAGQQAAQKLPASARSKIVDASVDQARQDAIGNLTPAQQAFRDTSMPSFREAGSYVKQKGSEAVTGLQHLYASGKQALGDWLHPPLQVTPPSQSFPDVRQVLESTKTSNPSVRPNLSRTPDRFHSADVEIDPRIQPPAPPVTRAPSRATPDEILRRSVDPNQNQGVGDPELAGSQPSTHTTGAPTPTTPPRLVSYEDYQKALESGQIPPTVGFTDFGLMVKSGRFPFPEGPFGPNTVGAAQDPTARLMQMLEGLKTATPASAQDVETILRRARPRLGPQATPEFPPGTTADDWKAPATQRAGNQRAKQWEQRWNDYEEQRGDPSEVARIRQRLQGLLDSGKP